MTLSSDDIMYRLWKIKERRWNNTNRGEMEGLGENLVPVRLSARPRSRGLAWDRKRACSVRSRWLKAQGLARPSIK